LLDEVPDDWFTAGGTHAELEREKKSLVRAIKEIEFDRDTGKLSAADAAALLGAYRGRAIEVIKVLDQGATGLSPRERVLAELKARAQVDRAGRQGQGQGRQGGQGGEDRDRGRDRGRDGDRGRDRDRDGARGRDGDRGRGRDDDRDRDPGGRDRGARDRRGEPV
jgi:hypothetical protein